MSERPTYVVSDIHLGAVPAETERAFRRFLAHVAAEADELVINGDLFDFWFEYRTVIHSQHFRVLAALADAADAGVKIRFLGGNHDAWGGAFLEHQIGMELLPDRVELKLAGWRALIAHGDGLGEGDLGYKALKKVIRNRVTTAAFRLLHPDLGSRIASLVSSTEGKHGNAAGASPFRVAQLRAWAEGELDRRPDLDLVLTGHTHTPTIEEYGPGRFYVNTGDWINHYTYLVLRPGTTPELKAWAS